MKNKNFIDILFENRNKAYGAYELRTTENRTLMKALLFGAGLITLGMGGFVFSNRSTENITHPINDGYDSITIADLSPIKKDEIVEPPIEEVQEVKREQLDTKQVKEIMPTPTVSPEKQETIFDREDTKDADLGADNRDGTMNSNNQVGGGDVSEGEKNISGNQNNKDIPSGKEDVKPVIENKKAITASKAKLMAIYPGCEKEEKKGNDALTKCMSDKLSFDLSNNLEDFASIAEKENITKSVAKMQFIISKNGEIIQIKPANGSDKSLGNEAKKALEKINKDLQRKGRKIKPAQYDDGSNADLIFSIPVRFQQL